MKIGRRLIVTLVIAVLANSAVAQEYRYAFFQLPPLGGDDSYGGGINELGTSVGSAFLPGNVFHATLWSEGQPLDLGTLGGSDSEARAINDDNWVVGWSRLPNGERGAFLWRNGQMENLGTLGGDSAEAQAINNSGQVVGWSEVIPGQGSPQSAFVWSDGEMSALSALEPGLGTNAIGINNFSEIVGVALITDPRHPKTTLRRAALWANGEVNDLGSLDPESAAVATAINDNSVVVGYSRLPTGKERATLWFNDRIHDLGTPGTGESVAYDINNAGQVVGFGNTGFSVFVGFLWEQSRGMQRLNDLAPPRLRDVGGIDTAWEINDAGQISGTAHPPGDPISGIAFLMSPVSPTMTLESPSPGGAGTNNTITITNVTPGARVTFLYSRHGGGTRIPGCDLQQNALQLDNPTVIGTATANQNGVATITRPVPLIARGQTILFQAVVQGECAISQLVVWRFE